VPSLRIAASRDQVMEPRYVSHLAGYAPGHELRLLEGAGHLPMRERTAQLGAILEAWLEQTLRSGANPALFKGGH
jgi:pimeloyl-ACP methyl ester carboxylesterase